MTHEKLVAGTTSPTRYTKIIRNPGAGTKYNRTYQEAEYVSRYTKTAAVGSSAASPAPPFEPLAIADGMGSNWLGTNVYQVGQTVTAKTAEYVGGKEPVTYRYRFQFKATGTTDWVAEPWINTTNSKNDVTYTLTETGEVKFQSQARDGSDPVVVVNSSSGIKTVVEPTEIGEVAVNPAEVMASVMDSKTFTAVVTGGDATDLTYKWEVRRGSAQIDTPDNQASATYTMIGTGQTQIQCTVRSANSSNSPQTNLSVVVVS